MSKSRQPTADTNAYPGAPAALAGLQARLLALPDYPVPLFRANVPKIVPNALRLARAYTKDRDKFVATFTPAGFDAAAYDDLEQRALALWQADVDLRLLVEPQSGLPRLLVPAKPLRRKLLRAAIYLWENDPELGDHVRDIRKGHGHVDLADDLTTLAALFIKQWDTARTRSDVTTDDVAEARRLGVEIAHALTRPGGDSVDAARNVRNRAGHYLRVGVERVYTAAQYVFLDEPDRLDAYPRLFRGIGGRRRPRPGAEDRPDGDTPGTPGDEPGDAPAPDTGLTA